MGARSEGWSEATAKAVYRIHTQRTTFHSSLRSSPPLAPRLIPNPTPFRDSLRSLQTIDYVEGLQAVDLNGNATPSNLKAQSNHGNLEMHEKTSLYYFR